ncbi:MAG: alanine--glyoxylate aminotransferase family protein [Bacillota bacterium]|nr:alanine--glyoxylate aminotransferase family protein [Bacillota bacterium]
MDRHCLMIPGPTPVPVRAALAGAGPMINHRGPEFGALLREVTERLQRILLTGHTVLMFPAAGTGGMEAVAANLVEPGERVLVAVAGEFGARFAEIMRVAGADVRTLDFEWGTAVDPAVVGTALEQDPSIGVVVVTHNETSTGVTMDLAGIRRAIPRDDVLLVADAISSVGAIELRPDEWGVDVVVGASQKGLMTPPGLALVALSPRAWEKAGRTRCRSVYWDFAAARRFLEHPTPQTPYTPAVSLLYALRESLRMLEAEGLENVFRRHAVLARAVRAGVRALGLGTLAGEDCASSTVTAVVLPDGLEGKKLLGLLRQKYGVVLAGGQGRLAGRIFRIGHVGQVNWQDVVVTLAALEMACLDLGREVERGRAVAAAEEVLGAEG